MEIIVYVRGHYRVRTQNINRIMNEITLLVVVFLFSLQARSLYMAGDYDGAQAAARCANAWSVAGLISGIILCAGIGVGTYFLVTNLY